MAPHFPHQPPQRTDLDIWSLTDSLTETVAALVRLEELCQRPAVADFAHDLLLRREMAASLHLSGSTADIEAIHTTLAAQPDDTGDQNQKVAALPPDLRQAVALDSAQTGAGQAVSRPSAWSKWLLRSLNVTVSQFDGGNLPPGAFRAEDSPITLSQTGETVFLPLPAATISARFDRLLAADRGAALPALIDAALLLAELIGLAPFATGNQRTARLIMPMMVARSGLVAAPVAGISLALMQQPDRHASALRRLATDTDWTGWVHHVLDALGRQARDQHMALSAIEDLRAMMAPHVRKLLNSPRSEAVIAAIFANPVFRNSQFPELSGLTKPTSLRFLSQLTKAGYLRQVVPAAGQRSAISAFDPALRLIRI